MLHNFAYIYIKTIVLNHESIAFSYKSYFTKKNVICLINFIYSMKILSCWLLKNAWIITFNFGSKNKAPKK